MESDFFPSFSGIVFALSAGFFGASFFMLVELQNRMTGGSLDDIKEMWKFSFLMLRCFVGIGGALILYFFFQTGLLQGSIWPDLTMLSFESLHDIPKLKVPNKDLSLLIVWSFLAGYSQTLVPSILVSTEARAGQGT